MKNIVAKKADFPRTGAAIACYVWKGIISVKATCR